MQLMNFGFKMMNFALTMMNCFCNGATGETKRAACGEHLRGDFMLKMMEFYAENDGRILY